MRVTASTTSVGSVQSALSKSERQARFAISVALNKTAMIAADEIRGVMTSVFDRPTPWVVKSLRISYATRDNLVAELMFKDRGLYGSSRTMIEPHAHGVRRHHKAMEVRLFRAGLLPAGWWVVPGQAARLDAFGNMSRGQVSQILNVLGTYSESGYNKANIKTIERLAKGNIKRGIYGFEYWVNTVGGKSNGLQPGVYQRVKTGFGTSLKPVLIFVRKVAYKIRLNFYGIVSSVANREFPSQFDAAFSEAMRTSILRQQGGLF